VADVVLDATVIVAHLNARDSHAPRARALFERLKRGGDAPVLLDFLVGEAVSVLARRASEGRLDQASFGAALAIIREWHRDGVVVYLDTRDYAEDALTQVQATGGRLSFNDGLLVALQRSQVIGAVASFDTGFDFTKLRFNRLS